MNACVCCHGQLLRHLKHRRSYWFCPTCHREMPNLSVIKAAKEILNSSYSLNDLADKKHQMVKT